MRKTLLYLAGVPLAIISTPVVAQNTPPDPIPDAVGGGTLTPEQMAAYDDWPIERKAVYNAWPTDAQAYFWTLPPERQELFWLLRDEDKLAIVAMDDTAREEAWAVVEERASTTPSPHSGHDTIVEPDEPDEGPETTEPVDPNDPIEPEIA